MYSQKRIALADKDGDIFKIYSTITKASENEGLNHTTITNYIKSGEWCSKCDCFFLEADEKTKINKYYAMYDFFESI